MQIYQKRSDSKISADNRLSRRGTVKKTYGFTRPDSFTRKVILQMTNVQ